MKWLKRLFFQKKTLEEVKNWLEEEQKKQQHEQQQATGAIQQEFPELLKTAKQKISALEQAELRNPNIPERAKHYMQGNREQFIKLSNRFADNLFVPKEAPDFSQLDILFQQYAQGTARPAAILSEFFGEEVKEIRKSLAETEAKISELKSLQIKKEQLETIQKLLQQINDIKTEQENVKKQKAEFEERLQQLKNKNETLKKEKEALTERPEYIKIKEDVISTAKERQEAEQTITGLFLPLSDPIKKYAHKMKNENLAKYAENPLNTLIHDYSLGILKHIQGIKMALTDGQVELKPERVQKALESIKQITRENLSAMIHRYANAKKREADIHHEVAQRPIMKEYEQYAEELKNIKNEIQELENTISKLKPPIEDEAKEQLRQELEKQKIVLL